MFILDDIERYARYRDIRAVRDTLSRFLSKLHVFSNEYPELTDAIDAVEIQALMSDPWFIRHIMETQDASIA